MERIPFRTFNGFIKQYAHESLSALEQEFFELLFPLFQGTPPVEATSQHPIMKSLTDPLAEILSPLIQILPSERRPRRYSGYGLPSGRYFALCKDIKGNDVQTLAHELRAYRDPVDIGMVEVLDLANGCRLMIRETAVTLAAQPAIAILIHEPQSLPDKFLALKFQQVPGLKEQPIFIYRFPYRVQPSTIERTIDLRFPEVRNWFYQTFRELPDLVHVDPIPPGKSETTPTIAHSRFHFENGQAPVPDSFWSMLPTLINSDIGGGSSADTGSTLLSMGHWMRQRNVSALIYPSARCDVTAIFEKGKLKDWQGWSLLDYRDAPLFGLSSIDLTTFVLSPWAWVALPPGVQLHVAEERSPFAGSFAVENMVNYWADDYLGQLKALEIARSLHGREKPHTHRNSPSEGLGYRAFQIGSLMIRWVRMLFQGIPAEQIERSVLELQGLALPYGLYLNTGRVLELWIDVKERSTPINELLYALLAADNVLFQSLKDRFGQGNFDKLAIIGADLELILFFVAVRVRAGAQPQAASLDVSGFLNEIEGVLAISWLDEALKTRIREYHTRALHEVKTGDAQAELCLEDGVELQHAIYNHLRAKESNQQSTKHVS